MLEKHNIVRDQAEFIHETPTTISLSSVDVVKLHCATSVHLRCMKLAVKYSSKSMVKSTVFYQHLLKVSKQQLKDMTAVFIVIYFQWMSFQMYVKKRIIYEGERR